MPRSGLRAARLAGLVVIAGLALAGCGQGSNADSLAALRASVRGQGPRVDRIVAELQTTLTSAGPHPDALLSDQFSALGARAEAEAAAVEGLTHPPAENTRLRDLGAALVAVANGLTHLATAATEHDAPQARIELRTLRSDATQVTEAQAALNGSLGVRSG